MLMLPIQTEDQNDFSLKNVFFKNLFERVTERHGEMQRELASAVHSQDCHNGWGWAETTQGAEDW